MDNLNALFSTREDNEKKIKDYAEISGFIDITPHLHTHLGRITLLDSEANLIEEVGGDWCIQGTLHQLTDEEFNKVYSAVRKDAQRVMSTVVNK